jgi:hypothetical protein
MGSGRFSTEAYEEIVGRKAYGSKSRDQIFESRHLDPEMDPHHIVMRESRDSVEHPESVAIVVGLDVTGSMGFVPEMIVKKSLPDLVGTIIRAGIPDPQVLFLGLGDFVYDRAPLQVGQFESSAELLDRWLTKVFLEGGGGGNNHESYNLAWLFAARHTSIDCWEKRHRKGFIFTLGDEPNAKDIPAKIITQLTSGKQAATIQSKDILEEARARYHVAHFHLVHDSDSAQKSRQEGWRDLLGQDFIVLDDYRKFAQAIAQFVIDRYTAEKGPDGKAEPSDSKATPEDML